MQDSSKRDAQIDADAARPAKIGFVSLGCPKALVDSERIVTRLKAEGYELARTHQGADLVIVNTCGFLDTAKAESLQAIGDALAENGKVIVTGCLGSEPEAITEHHPHVLAVTGPQQYEKVMDAVHRAAPRPHAPFLDLVPPQGVKLTPRHYAYLKISEGCNNRCTFCIIPRLRGDLVSRRAADVLREAEKLVDAGVKELLVISQDTSAYGVDLKYAASAWGERDVRARFVDLVSALGGFDVWVRLHYVYPYPHIDEVIPLMAEGKVLPYLDVPFQHAAPAVLARMRRPAAQEKTLARIRRWREMCPELTIRSTFIVGFPGETEEDFAFLLDWLNEASLDRVGCFRYEPVRGAAANELAPPIPDEVKEERWHRFMQRQQAISAKRLKAKIGTRQQVIIDEPGPARFQAERAPVGRPESAPSQKAGAQSDAKPAPTFADRALCLAKGRSKADAPEIDGAVYVAARRPLRAGEIATVKIERADAYDLYGTAVGFS